MMPRFSRDQLIHMLRSRHCCRNHVFIKSRPEVNNTSIECVNCGDKNFRVRLKQERYGEGTPDHVYWVANTWAGACTRCLHLNLWIELVDSDELERENRRLLVLACDRELKSL